MQYTDGNAVDIVNVNAAKTQINLVPDLGDLPAPRTVDLQLVYKLANFPNATPFIDPFQVELLECVPSLGSSAVVSALQDQTISWGAAPTPYDVSGALALYTQTPDCQFGFTY